MPTRQNDGQVLVTVKADGTGDVGQVCVVGVCLAVHLAQKRVFRVGWWQFRPSLEFIS